MRLLPSRPHPLRGSLRRTRRRRPAPASSGNTTRHRLNRSGDRQLNRAFDGIVRTRMSFDPATKDYVTRGRATGKIKPRDPPQSQTLRLQLHLPPAADHHGLTGRIEESFWVDVPGQIGSSRRRISFSCSNKRLRFFSSRISADSAVAGPAPESLRSAMAIQA
jgi:hypothetical protein